MIMPNGLMSYRRTMTGAELKDTVRAFVEGCEGGFTPFNRGSLPVVSGIAVQLQENDGSYTLTGITRGGQPLQDDDTVTVRVGDAEYTIGRNGVTGGEGVQANVVSSDAGYEVVADIPYTGAEKDIVEMNVIATDSATTETSAWSTNDTGAVTLAEPLSYTEAVKVPADAKLRS